MFLKEYLYTFKQFCFMPSLLFSCFLVTVIHDYQSNEEKSDVGGLVLVVGGGGAELPSDLAEV